MAARFTEYQGDPAWLKAQRDAQARHSPTQRQQKAFPYPSQAPRVTPTKAKPVEFVTGAKSSQGWAALGFVLGAVLSSRKHRDR